MLTYYLLIAELHNFPLVQCVHFRQIPQKSFICIHNIKSKILHISCDNVALLLA